MNDIRAFIAIDLPKVVLAELAELQQELAKSATSKSVRWVKPENIHLTLRFLGDIDQRRLTEVSKSLDKLARDIQRFGLELDSLGCFPNPRKPKVIWVGVGGETTKLQAVYQGLEQILEPIGWKPEGRRYHPHLTLGRAKDHRQVIDARFPWGKKLAEGKFAAAALHLVKSDLLPSGAEYTILHSAIFTG